MRVCDYGFDTSLPELLTMRFGVVSACRQADNWAGVAADPEEAVVVGTARVHAVEGVGVGG